MSKLFKKISAIVLTAIMVLTMCSAVFAESATTDIPKSTDKAKITVKNVEQGATVTAYQIVKAKYIEGIGFEKYERVSEIRENNLTNPTNPTAEEITNIALNIASGNSKLKSLELEYNSETGEYETSKATAGYWVVLVTGGNTDKVYNPMLAGVYYSVSGSDNTMIDGKIDASKKWKLNNAEAYEKSVDVNVNKTIVNSSSKNEKGDDHAYGDYVQFKVTGKIPAYTSAYTKATYSIVDTLSDGLELQTSGDGHSMVLKVKNVEASLGKSDAEDTSSKNATWKIVNNDDGSTTLTVDLSSTFVLNNAGQDVEFTYWAKVKEEVKDKSGKVTQAGAGTNFDGEKNAVKVVYTNDPTIKTDGTTNTGETPESKTYHYTFELDGNLFGNSEIVTNKVTHELTKTGTKDTTEKIYDTQHGKLVGAKFKLTNTSTKKEYEATSDSDGQLNFKGLDAGDYTLQETYAPSPYSLNSTVYNVKITAEYNDNGTLKSYSVEVNASTDTKYSKTFTYTATYSETNTEEITAIGQLSDQEQKTYEIINTPISELPSTGGMGTYIFTIVGVVLMACAAGAFMVSRRKSEN